MRSERRRIGPAAMSPGSPARALMAILGVAASTRGSGRTPAGMAMTGASAETLSELDTMEGLLLRLAKAFNHRNHGKEAGMEGVAGEVVHLAQVLRVRRGEPAVEVVSDWLDERLYREPLE